MKKYFYFIAILLFSVSTAFGIGKVHIPVPKTANSAKSVIPDKINNTPSINFFYEQNGLEINGNGLLGPTNATKNILYRLNDENPAVGDGFKVDSILTNQTVPVGSGSMITDIINLILEPTGSAPAGLTTFPDYSDSTGTKGQYAINTAGTLLAMCVDTNSWRTVALSNTLTPTPSPPVLSLASVAVDGTDVALTFNKTVSKGVNYSDTYFNIDASVSGNDIGLTYVSDNGTVYHYTSAVTILQNEIVNLDFVPGAVTDILENVSGEDLVAITDFEVTNGSAQTGPAYTTSFSDDFNRADNASVISGSSWSAEIDTGSIATITNNTYQTAHNGANFCRIEKTFSVNNTDYEITFDFKMSDVALVDTSGSTRTMAMFVVGSSGGTFLTLGVQCNASGNPYRFVVIRNNDVGTSSYTYVDYTFTADEYVPISVQVDIGEAATSDGICKIMAGTTELLNITASADETRPVMTYIRLQDSTTDTAWNQANTFTFDNLVVGYK